jgi:DNA-directed RNA polymerase subunit H
MLMGRWRSLVAHQTFKLQGNWKESGCRGFEFTWNGSVFRGGCPVRPMILIAAKKGVDVSKHVLIPKHAKVSEKEKSELLERYGVSELELPRMLKTDAAISDLGVKPGDIIRIVRKSPTAGESIFYRVIVNA